MFKQQYYAALDPKPVWPMQLHRVNAIYGTMKRTIRKSQEEDKANLKLSILSAANDFETNCQQIVSSHEDFDMWFDYQVLRLQEVPFAWRDARNIGRSGITFGLAQKFLNLTLKDWWCVSQAAQKLDYSALHAPFDRIMRDRLWKLTRIDFPSLRQGGYYVYLSRSDYDRYQEHLLSAQLWGKLTVAQPLKRIEVEQLVWGS